MGSLCSKAAGRQRPKANVSNDAHWRSRSSHGLVSDPEEEFVVREPSNSLSWSGRSRSRRWAGRANHVSPTRSSFLSSISPPESFRAQNSTTLEVSDSHSHSSCPMKASLMKKVFNSRESFVGGANGAVEPKSRNHSLSSNPVLLRQASGSRIDDGSERGHGSEGWHSCRWSSFGGEGLPLPLDGWSMRTFSELVASSRSRERLKCADMASPCLVTNGAEPRMCGLCSGSLSQKPPWMPQRVIGATSNDPAVAAVLACGHVFHADCLERTTLETDILDPPCPHCISPPLTKGSPPLYQAVKAVAPPNPHIIPTSRNKLSRVGIATDDAYRKPEPPLPYYHPCCTLESASTLPKRPLSLKGILSKDKSRKSQSCSMIVEESSKPGPSSSFRFLKQR